LKLGEESSLKLTDYISGFSNSENKHSLYP